VDADAVGARERWDTSTLDVLAAGNNGGGTTSANLVPLEGCQRPPAIDTVQDTDNPHEYCHKQAKQVGHAHHKEANSNVDDALHEAVVEEGELGGDQRHVELTEDHDDAKGNREAGDYEEGEAEVLVTQNTVGVEGCANIHFNLTTILRFRMARDTVVARHAIVVGHDRPVFKRDFRFASDKIFSAETRITERKVVAVCFNNANRVRIPFPFENEKLMLTSPSPSRAQALCVAEFDRMIISLVPPDELGREEIARIASNGHNAKDGKKNTCSDSCDKNNLGKDEFAGALNFPFFHIRKI